MRLVRDVAIDDFVEETDEKAPAVDAEGELLQAEHSRSSPLGEQPDGAVDEIESNDETVAEPANARALEALLLGTHHPLTAGRLAELLDLASQCGERSSSLIRSMNRPAGRFGSSRLPGDFSF